MIVKAGVSFSHDLWQLISLFHILGGGFALADKERFFFCLGFYGKLQNNK